MRRYAKLAVLAILAAPVFAQAPASSLTAVTTSAPAPGKFLAADVHVVPPGGSTGHDTYHFGDRAILRRYTMSDLIASAYGLKDSTYIGGAPAWLDWDRYDIVAMDPPDATQPGDRQLMLQNLLADRFRLVVHPGDVPVPGYQLTVARGKPNLKLSAATKEGGCKFPPPPKPEPGLVPPIVIACRAAGMDSLVTTLSTMGFDGIRPLVDATGLEGAYDFDLQWTPKDLMGLAGPAGITLFQAVEQQLGLRLELKAGPRPGLVVDSVNEEPTPNSPHLDKIMPPLPPQQFEVATIRPAQLDEPTRRRTTDDEVNYQGASLKSLIVSAWDLNPKSNQVLVAPKWISDEHFDIHAKLPGGEVMNWDEYAQTLRALLIDRFQIKYHMEDRPVDTYALVADHPKLVRADPSEKIGCNNVPRRGEKDPRLENPTLGLRSCRNITMGQLAGLLPYWAPGYFHDPVQDATGLNGAWDFTIAWNNMSFFQNAAGPGAAQTSASGDAPAASAPTGAISFFDAVQKLGLKLVERKIPEPVLVIDQINKQPTEN